MSKKFDNFVSALVKLCNEHDVQICADEYDLLQVWDKGLSQDDYVIDLERLEDKTKDETS